MSRYKENKEKAKQKEQEQFYVNMVYAIIAMPFMVVAFYFFFVALLV